MVLTTPTPSNNNNTMMKTKAQGRRKVEMKKIEKVNHRHVTFSKRRSGLFKKASELSILTGAEMAIIVNSPAQRVFAFGHPSVDSIIDRYLTGIKPNPSNPCINEALMHEYNKNYSEISGELEMEMKRKEMLKKGVKNEGFWWDKPVEGLGLDELEKYIGAMEEMKKKVVMRADEVHMFNSTNMQLFLNGNEPQNRLGLAYDDPIGNAMIPPWFFRFAHGQI